MLLSLRSTGGIFAVEDFFVFLDIRGELRRDILFRENGSHRALRLAGTAVDALVRVDIELVFPFVYAIHRAHVDAGAVFHSNAGFNNHIGHPAAPLAFPGAARLAKVYEG
jgi:hypothetical protein